MKFGDRLGGIFANREWRYEARSILAVLQWYRMADVEPSPTVSRHITSMASTEANPCPLPLLRIGQ